METQPNPLFYPVIKVELGDLGLMPGFIPNRSITHAVVVNTESESRIVQFCSNDYEVQTNESIITPILRELESQGLRAEMTYKIRDYAKFHIDFISKDFITQMSNGDPIFPRMRIQNSYDGTLKYQASFGMWRQVCSNGLTVPLLNEITRKFMHTAQVADGALVSETIEIFKNFCSRVSEFIQPFTELQEKKLYNVENKIAEVIAATSYPKRLAEGVLERLNLEVALLNTQPNYWLFYNAFNYMLSHGESKAKENKKDKIDVEVLEYLIQD